MLEQETVTTSRFGSIRSRLILAFILIVLLPMTIISAVLAISATQGTQLQTSTQLEIVASYKENAINSWVTALQRELGNGLIGENTVQQIEALQQATLAPEDDQLARATLRERWLPLTSQNQQFEAIFIMNPQGKVVLSTDPALENQSYANQTFFQRGLEKPFASLTQTGQGSMIVAQPVLNDRQVIGVIAGRANLNALNEIMTAPAGLGITGKAYLVGNNQRLLTSIIGMLPGNELVSQGIQTALKDQVKGSGAYEDYRGVPVVGAYRWMPGIEAALLVEQEQAETSQGSYAVLAVNIGVALASILIAAMASLSVTRSIATPLTNLSETAARISGGDLDLIAETENQDEIGQLATDFNRMTSQLRNSIATLESRVSERTTKLEQQTAELENVSGKIKKRAEQLQAVAQVGRAVTSIQNLEELLPYITKITSEQLGFYHVGIFLLDTDKEFAVLSAANSEGGQKMLKNGHKLQVGAEGIVGYVASQGRPRIALDTGADAVFFSNPDLPETHSEMALPLRAGSEVIGVLDVQSEQPAAFGQEDIELLTILADQVTIAIQNARRFQETQEAIQESEATIRQYLRREWKGIVDEAQNPGYRFSNKSLGPLDLLAITPNMLKATRSGETSLAQEASKREMAIPIKLRGQVIGIMRLQSNSQRSWEKDIVDITQAIADRVALAIENARLLESSQDQAARERTIGEITSKIGASVNLRNVLQTAVEELGRILPGSDVVIQLESGKSKE